ncbi:MAG: NAD(+)/NADH kinase [Clostridiaceae bacterium]|nr:NAD(+)/NADH kinase [Clostridiaceae bacterium]
MLNIALIPNISKDKDFMYANFVAKTLSMGASVRVPEEYAGKVGCGGKKVGELIPWADLVILLGGDGTILGAARDFFKYEKPMLAINFGHLGFLTEIDQENFQKDAKKVINGEFSVEKRLMLYTKVIRDEKTVGEFYSLNDVVLSRTSPRIFETKAFVDGDFLDSYRADGVIVSTPTGSTAYSMSAGGPILHPKCDCFVLTPICPHRLNARAIVLPSDCTIRLSCDIEDKKARLSSDGQTGMDILKNDVIEIKKSPYYAHLARTNTRTFFELLRYKLNGENNL